MRSINTRILFAVFCVMIAVFTAAGFFTATVLSKLEQQYLNYMSAAVRLTDEYRDSVLHYRQELDVLPRRLIVDGAEKVELLVAEAGSATRVDHAEDAMAARYDRAGRRDLRRPGLLLVDERDGTASVSFGKFAADGAFQGVRELRSNLDATALRAIVERVDSERSDPDAIKAMIDRTFNDLGERLLKSDTTERLVSAQETVRDARAQLVSAVNDIPWLLLLIALGTITAAILAVTITTRRLVVRPLIQQTSAIERISGGDFRAAEPSIARRDEIGALASAVEAFRASSLRVQELESERAKAAIAEVEHRRRDREVIAGSFESSVNRTAEAVGVGSGEILDAARSMVEDQGQAASCSIRVADAAAEATQRLTVTVAAVTELGASIGEIAEQASRSSTFTATSVKDVDQAVEQMLRLNAVSGEIHAVSELIRGIARQTNLLALNATIEASRAGEAGRGFAVVAGEVKQLADQTASATEGIARQIKAIQTEADQAVSAIGRVKQSIHAISDNTTGIAAAVEQQRASTDEISRALTSLNDRMATVTEQIKEVTGRTILSSAGSIQVLWTAQTLSETSGGLTSDADEFLAKITAG